MNDYWKWLQESFVWNIRAQSWYNGEVPLGLRGFIDDKTNRLVGWPVIRQLRVKPGLFPRFLSDDQIAYFQTPHVECRGDSVK